MRKLIEKSSLLLALLSMVLLQFSVYQISAITCIEKEREALLQLKKSFIDPSHRLASWNGTDCCNWNGVGCDQSTGHVTMIDLRNKQVSHATLLTSNSIDSSLLEFKYLEYLDLSFNKFSYSQIPNFLGSMLELRYLNLSHAFLYGKVPPHLGNLSKLVVLDLSTNEFRNQIWESLNGDVEWITHLSSLKILDLSGMNFIESSNLMQVVSSLPLLWSLRLISCNLQNIHLSLRSLNSSFLSRIQRLDLSHNNFHGPIPKAFQNMSSMRFLYLSNNQFTTIEGGLSFFIGNHCGLEVFDLSFNQDLVGDVFGSYENVSMHCNRYDLQILDLTATPLKQRIPNWLEKLQNLRSLKLASNHIYGPIPPSLGNLSSMEYLDLSRNDLNGPIPSSLGRLLNLRELYLASNGLEEVGVECFSQLGNLEILDISNNSLEGVISEAHFANLSQLRVLAIAYTDFLSLDMKHNWIPPFQLNFLFAASCKCFGNKFPQWLQTQKELLSLQLRDTSISSSLPTWLRGQNLLNLDLSHNQIVGPLPTTIGDQMSNLMNLLLNDNQINDSLPLSLCKMKNLSILDLSNNRLSGMVHGCLLTPNLFQLDFSSNKFSGTFSYSPGTNLSNIQQLCLGNNNFEGSMPIVLKSSIRLQFLDLEGNQFSGNIPTWVGDNLKYLQVLKLRGNFFNGTIPSNLCHLTYLQNLDLANNKLVGNILPNLSNFSVMTGKMKESVIQICFFIYEMSCSFVAKDSKQHFKSNDYHYSLAQQAHMVNIDLSNNSLVGFIPREITMLKKLLGLNLSHNNLVGTIPIEMGRIESLESLDLSFNRLSGPIPNSMSKLSSLGVLKLSHNNLSGDIPREGHLLTFNEVSSFDGNPYLCGQPLPVKCAIENPFEPPFKLENLDQEEVKWEKWMLCIMIILGYTTGFWVVVGALILKRNWRHAYFKFVDETKYKARATMWRSIEILKGICNHK